MARIALSFRLFSPHRFSQLFRENYIPTPTFLDKIQVASRAGWSAFRDPKDSRSVAALGDVLSSRALHRMHTEMQNDPIGREILLEKPLLDEHELNLDALYALPVGTLGHAYVDFMESHNLTLFEREPVHYIEEEELAYVMTRYRQLHDFLHVAYGLSINVENEVALKCIELMQTRFPMTLFATFLGPFTCPRNANRKMFSTISSKKNRESRSFQNSSSEWIEESPRDRLEQQLLPWALSAAMKLKRPLHLVYIERWLDQPLDAFREYCGILLPTTGLPLKHTLRNEYT
ncbi:coenzyme q (ubiquinone) biosynthesis protein coq4 protein [Cardiosporidium cionae]|uniref:Ubiquinone biosynthesis protein COQ4 homolog, mitochondrial n=1 Tax=Cardiosporidium cionae TaxID=476202 RepID=A0ABQ7J7M6_9APIC|nr:coenzyme q (ubiquinone) biosynthesis protein coq4 protein [Cardiosporidium cionae]|eukprot:KAF8819998.1 coenzyme q (ubiquinone) biosynthesis protein coq4 protein [Cardiosporidium cionae]